jgi:hypothetical protein
MIDDKKIEAAKEEIYEDRFLLNGEDVVFDNDAKEEMFYKEDIKEAIGLGAKWIQEEFLKDLWHPIDEEPKLVGEEIIIEMFIKDKRHTIVLEYMVGEEIPIGLESVRWITDWNSFKQSRDNVIKSRWFYFKDLLPKKGGNQ